MPEKVKHRRGEPVVLTHDDGTERLGTIEWGDPENGVNASVYCEVGGRAIVQPHEAHKMRPDPGGLRPVWNRVVGGRATLCGCGEVHGPGERCGPY